MVSDAGFTTQPARGNVCNQSAMGGLGAAAHGRTSLN